jgi:hypothetical protein
MAMYSIARDSVALNTAADFLTLITVANRPIQIVEISVAGMGTASAANSLGVYRSSGGATPTGPIVAVPMGKVGAVTTGSAPVAATTSATGWTTQPTITASAGYGLILTLGVNANGGIYRWVARPGEEIVCVGTTDTISFRAITGTSTVSLHVVFMEDCF